MKNNHVSIVQAPNEVLQTKSIEVTDFKEAEKITQQLIAVTEKVDRLWKPWLGMAAPQIGYNKRIVLIKKSFTQYVLLINPKVVKKGWLLPMISGCYSLKGFYLIRSYFWFEIKYQDIDQNYHEITFTGGKAATFHQEIDHIDGILISDRGRRII